MKTDGPSCIGLAPVVRHEAVDLVAESQGGSDVDRIECPEARATRRAGDMGKVGIQFDECEQGEDR